MNAEPDDKKPSDRAHLVAIDTLIVHKYAGSAPLMRKADKVAREIIDSELRDGEYLQVVKAGRYYLHFPQLRPDAGQLRCSVIVSQIERAIRHLNPTSFELHESDEGMLASSPAPEKEAASSAPPPVASVRVPPRDPAAEAEAEKRKLASEAMKMMITTETVTREELVGSDLGRFLDENVVIEPLPVWNVRSKLISAYECVSVRHGALVSQGRSIIQNSGVGAVEIKAILDAIVLARTCALLNKNIAERKHALLICPVHASTLDNKRYVGAYLASGASLTGEAQKSLVFLLREVPLPISRLKLSDLSRYLRLRARGVMAEQPPGTRDFAVFKELGFHAMKMNMDGAREETLLADINKFVEKCERAKLESFIGGVTTNSLAVGALASGCTYLSGSVIAERATKNVAVKKFALDSLFDSPVR